MPWDPGPSHPGEEAQQNDPDHPGIGRRVETICCYVQESQLLDLLDRAFPKKKSTPRLSHAAPNGARKLEQGSS